MSNFKEKLKMFEVSRMPPQIKQKPIRSKFDSRRKSEIPYDETVTRNDSIKDEFYSSTPSPCYSKPKTFTDDEPIYYEPVFHEQIVPLPISSELGMPESGLSDTVLHVTVPAVTVLPNTVLADTVLPDTVLPDTVLPNSVLPVTIPTVTALPVTIPPDTVLPDTVLPDPIHLENYLDECTYDIFECVYDLPGLENFDFDAHLQDTQNETESLKSGNDQVQEECYYDPLDTIDGMEIDDINETEEITLAPSHELVEEIVSTSILRNSKRLSEDIVHVPNKNSNKAIKNVAQNSSALDGQKNMESPRKRSIFSSIFKSKKMQKKSGSQNNSDTDSLQSMDQIKSNHTEDDSKSTKSGSKKPLNSLLDRDWLNNIGEGVKKKASVMSELKRLFGYGMHKVNKKMSSTNDPDVHMKKCDKRNQRLKPLDFVYDEDPEELSENISKNLKSPNNAGAHVVKGLAVEVKGKNMKTNDIKGSDTDSIYDEEYDEECDETDMLENENLQRPEMLKMTEVYILDDNESENQLESKVVDQKRISKTSSDNESIYDDEIETEDVSTFEEQKIITKKNKPESKVVKGKPSIDFKKKKTFFDIIPKKSSKKSQLYDEDVEVIEEYESDNDDLVTKNVENPDKVKRKVKCVIKNNDSSKKSNSKTLIKKVSTSHELYDEDVQVVEEYASDVDNTSDCVEENKTKSTRENQLEKNKEELKVFVKSPGSKKNINNNKLKQSEVYDEDIEILEKSTGDKSNIKINNHKTDSKTKKVTEKNTNKLKDLQEKQNHNFGKLKNECASVDIIYDDDDDASDVDSVYDNGEEEEEEEDRKTGFDIKGKGLNMIKSTQFFKAISSKKNTKKYEELTVKAKEIVKVPKSKDFTEIIEEYISDEDEGKKFDEPKLVKGAIVGLNKMKLDEKRSNPEIKLSGENRPNNKREGNDEMLFKKNLVTKLIRRQLNPATSLKNTMPIVKNIGKTKPLKDIEYDEDEIEESLEADNNVDRTEDEDLKKVIKKNLDKAKKTFKLKEPIRSISTARALKTIYLETKQYMQFNNGEMLEVLEYRNGLALVKNGVGKCGLTSLTNIQIIKKHQ